MPYFSGRGYRCVAWDQPGYGGTAPVEPYTFEKLSEALARQIDEPAVLVGHSMGGMLAQETYARYPGRVTALVLTFTSPAFPAACGDFAREFVAAAADGAVHRVVLGVAAQDACDTFLRRHGGEGGEHVRQRHAGQ